MAPKPGRETRSTYKAPKRDGRGVFRPRKGHRQDGRRKNQGVGLDKLVAVRSQHLAQTLPEEKTFKSKTAYTFAKQQLAENGVRYQVFHVGPREYVAVRLDIPADDVKRSREFKRLMHVLKTRRGRDAHGPLARALVELGLRDETWTWPVGES
jgi:hypothetical protein